MNENVGLEGKTKWLVLIPTDFEASKIREQFSLPQVQIEICGFGPMVSAANSAHLLTKCRPEKVILVGIAGSYDPSLQIGSAYRFSSVTSDGIGAGEGSSFQSAKEMGWSQGLDPRGNPIGDVISLNDSSHVADTRQLLTVCAAADGTAMTKSRQQRFPDAAAEDMEGFGVAAACQICDTELVIVRGISNQAGDRDKSNWRIDEALSSAASVVLDMIGPKH